MGKYLWFTLPSFSPPQTHILLGIQVKRATFHRYPPVISSNVISHPIIQYSWAEWGFSPYWMCNCTSILGWIFMTDGLMRILCLILVHTRECKHSRVTWPDISSESVFVCVLWPCYYSAMNWFPTNWACCQLCLSQSVLSILLTISSLFCLGWTKLACLAGCEMLMWQKSFIPCMTKHPYVAMSVYELCWM